MEVIDKLPRPLTRDLCHNIIVEVANKYNIPMRDNIFTGLKTIVGQVHERGEEVKKVL
jgi:hypothetical protein